MKNVTLSLLLFVTALQLSAQERAPLYLGGQFSLRIFESGLSGQERNAPNVKNSFTDFTFSPYFIWEKPNGSARGVSLSFGYRKGEGISGLNSTMDQDYSIGVGVFNRILLSENTATLKFWLSPEVSLQYTQAKREKTINSARQENKLYGVGAQLGAGISYPLSPKFRITAAWRGLNYGYGIGKRDDMEGVSYFHNLNMSINPSSLIFGVEMRLR